MKYLNIYQDMFFFQYVSENSLEKVSEKVKNEGLFLNENLIKSFIWIMPWAVEAIQKSQYFQIDASF